MPLPLPCRPTRLSSVPRQLKSQPRQVRHGRLHGHGVQPRLESLPKYPFLSPSRWLLRWRAESPRRLCAALDPNHGPALQQALLEAAHQAATATPTLLQPKPRSHSRLLAASYLQAFVDAAAARVDRGALAFLEGSPESVSSRLSEWLESVGSDRKRHRRSDSHPSPLGRPHSKAAHPIRPGDGYPARGPRVRGPAHPDVHVPVHVYGVASIPGISADDGARFPRALIPLVCCEESGGDSSVPPSEPGGEPHLLAPAGSAAAGQNRPAC